MELEELKRLVFEVDAKAILSRPVEALRAPGETAPTEYRVAKDLLNGWSVLRIGERDIKIPGMTRHKELILKVLADFKTKKKRNFVPPQFAKSDDITMEPLRPEVFDLDNFYLSGLTVGTVDIIPQTAGYFELSDDEVIVITDWIEMLPDITITALQAEIDGVIQNPVEMRLALKATDMQIYELDYPWIIDLRLDVNGKVEFAGDSELTPIGVHICLGKELPSLT